MGYALGLGHADGSDPYNIMNETVDRNIKTVGYFSEEQIESMLTHPANDVREEDQ